jgi:hypothetical protein
MPNQIPFLTRQQLRAEITKNYLLWQFCQNFDFDIYMVREFLYHGANISLYSYVLLLQSADILPRFTIPQFYRRVSYEDLAQGRFRG